MRLHTQILLGLVTGAVLGILANLLLAPGTTEWINHYVANPIGQVFLRMLFMIVMPLVFASISLGVASMGDLRSAGRVGGKTLAYFAVTTAFAAILGLILVNVVEPGAHLSPDVRDGLLATYAADASAKVETAAKSTFGMDTIINIVTRNPVKSAVDGDMLGMIFFGILFGAALTMVRQERGAGMMDFLRGLNEVMEKIVAIAMRVAPFGVAGLIFGVFSRFGFALLEPLGLYVAVVLGGLILHACGTMSLIMRFLLGVSPLGFYSRVRESLVTAFSTSSSNATLPTNIAVGERNLGVPPRIAGFVYPLGATMCMHGTALFEGVTVLFLAQVFGVPLTLTQMVIVTFMCVITAVGAAGVPGGSIPLLVGVLGMVGVPAEGIALVLGVDRILDMSRTTLNVLGDHTAAVWIAKTERLWTPASLPPRTGADGRGLDESPDWPPAEPG
jgi:DAACS family dicarboxylate/amino acid:cation (Na+ or H+) symporter